MPRHSAYRSNNAVDGAEWSYSQYLVVIIVAILLCVTSFTVGYIIAHVDRDIATDGRIAANSSEPAKLTPPPPAEDPKKADPAPAKPEVTPPTREVVKRPPLTPAEVPALPNPGTGPTPMVKTPVALPKPQDTPAPTPEPTPPPAPAAETPPAVASAPLPAPKPTPVPAAPVTAPKPTPPTVTKAPAPNVTPPKAPAPSVALGSWGIQVAFFDGKDRKKQAETVKQRLKTSENQDAVVVVSNNDKEYRVMISGFTTRDAAKAACEKLKAKTGFADAWVKRLP